MKFTDEVRARVLAALVERLPDQQLRACFLCGTTQWQLIDAFLAFEISTSMIGHRPVSSEIKPTVTSKDFTLPCVTMYCTNCGNTLFLNLVILGLTDLLSQPDAPDDPALIPLKLDSKGKSDGG